MLDETNRQRFALTAGLGCAVLTLLMLVAIPAAFLLPLGKQRAFPPKFPNPLDVIRRPPNNGASGQELGPVKQVIPGLVTEPASDLYNQVNPGIVSIRTYPREGTPNPEVIATGIILDEAGNILTSQRLDARYTFLTIVFSEGQEKVANQTGFDVETGLTILKVDSLAAGARPLDLSQAGEVGPGEWCYIISGDYQSGGSIRTSLISTAGSALDLGITGTYFPRFLQLDQPLAEEFTGAPIFNLRGQFIGLLTALRSQKDGESARVQEVIPAIFLQKIAPELAEKGEYPWAWIGIEGITLNLPLQEANNFTTSQGIYVDRIIAGSPAEKAGLRGTSGTQRVNGMDIPSGGDLILAVNGNPVRDYDEFLQTLIFQKPGDEVTLTTLHREEIKDVKVVLGSKPGR